MAESPYLCCEKPMVASFEWDPDKDAENQRKHGVSFAEAQAAFLDSGRVIAGDPEHSRTEPRLDCFGRVTDGVLTVRFTYRGNVTRSPLCGATDFCCGVELRHRSRSGADVPRRNQR
jgi:uncharacterized protein